MNERNKNLKSSLQKLDKDVLLDGFCLLYEEFREDARAVQEATPSGVTKEAPEIPNFVSLILYMKSRYAFEELNDITVEGGRVFFKRGGRRIELSREEGEPIAAPLPEDKGKEEAGGGRFGRLELS